MSVLSVRLLVRYVYAANLMSFSRCSARFFFLVGAVDDELDYVDFDLVVSNAAEIG